MKWVEAGRRGHKNRVREGGRHAGREKSGKQIRVCEDREGKKMIKKGWSLRRAQ